MQVYGITWHAVVLEPEPFAAMEEFVEATLGLTPTISEDGRRLYRMPNGTMLDLYSPHAVPPYGFTDGTAFGFRVNDLEKASAAAAEAGAELLGEVMRLPALNYASRHFRGPDGRVYGFNELRQPLIEW